MENKIRLLEKANREIEKINYFLNSNIPIEQIQRIKNFILSNEYLMKLYSIKNPIDLTAKYLKRVNELRKDLNDKNDFQFLANILEYFRFMNVRENIAGVTPEMTYYENLSDSRFSSLILGKTSAAGQITAMSDILSNRFKTSLYDLRFYEVNDDVLTTKNKQCLVITDETGKHYIDVYHYNGKMDIDNDNIAKNYIDDVYPFILDDITLRKAKRRVSNYLIKKLNIKELLKSLELDGLSEKEKNQKFIEYIKSNQDDYDGLETNTDTILVNGNLLETSRLLELFYIASKIRYRVANDQKENSTFEVILDDESTLVSLNDDSAKKLVK